MELIQGIKRPSFKARSWLKTISAYAFSQGIAQVLAFASGMIIVRSTSKTEYAYYAIAVSIISATALVADSGLNSSLMHLGSRYRLLPERLSSLYTAAMRFRFYVSAPIIFVGAGLVGFLLYYNGLTATHIVIVCAIVLLTLMLTVTTATLQTYHRLDYNFSLIRRAGLLFAATRLLLVFLVAILSSNNLYWFLLVGLVCAVLLNNIYRVIAAKGIDFHGSIRSGDWREFKLSARRTLPMTLVLVLSEQSILFILSFTSSPEVIADVSALSRFGVAFAIVNMIVSDIGAPVFARTKRVRRILIRRLSLVLVLYLAMATVVILCVLVYAPFLLSLLGNQYAGLEVPLVIIATGTAVLNFGHALSSMNQARGWLTWSWIYIPLSIVWFSISIIFIDMTQTFGAALFMASQALPLLITQMFKTIVGVCQSK